MGIFKGRANCADRFHTRSTLRSITSVEALINRARISGARLPLLRFATEAIRVALSYAARTLVTTPKTIGCRRCSSMGNIVSKGGLILLLGLGLLANASAQDVSRFQVSPAGRGVDDTATGLVVRRCIEGQRWNGYDCVGPNVRLDDQGAHQYRQTDAIQYAMDEAKASGKAWKVPTFREIEGLDQLRGTFPRYQRIFPSTPSGLWISADRKDKIGGGRFLTTYGGARWGDSDMGYLRLVR